MSEDVKTSDLFENVPQILLPLFSACEYPWQIVEKLGRFMDEICRNIPDGYSLLSDKIIVGQNVDISPTATIIAPAFIGHNSTLRPGAYIRGNVFLSDGCTVGNSTEIKNSILLDKAEVPHYNYIGDSVLGASSHMGAGAICSNLKSDGRNVVVHANTDYETNLRKLGAVLGDNADVGCGCVLNPGTIIGKNTRVYPLTSVRGVIGENRIVKSMDNIIKRENV